MKPKYDIGDVIYWATSRNEEQVIECPDCKGSGQLTVIFADGEQVSVACANCAWGYDPPTGRVRYWGHIERVESGAISGMEIDTEVTYKVRCEPYSSYYCIKEAEAYDSKEEAQEQAVILAAKRTEEELKKAQRKHKDTRSWAWNASYHRKELKEAKRRVGYHTEQLSMCNLKAKEQEKEITE